MKTYMRNVLAGNLSRIFLALIGLSVVIFVLILVPYWAGSDLRARAVDAVSYASDVATTVGFFLAAASVFIAISALQQSLRSTDLRILDARQWLKRRQQVVAEIEYAMYASPTLLANLRPHDPSKISRREAIRFAVSVVGTFRRLRDSLSGFASDRGFLLTHAVMQERIKATTSSAFETHLVAYTKSVECVPTTYLKHIYPWLFGRGESVPNVPLSPEVMLHAYTEVMVELDYLDQRVSSLLATLADEDAKAVGLAAVEDGNAGAVLHEALVTSAKDVYCHLVVMRAFLEVEWSAMFPRAVDSSQLEGRISALLAAGDDASFIACSPGAGTTSIDDNVAGFRFAHAVANVSTNSVFEDDLSLSKPKPTAGNEAPSRIQRLYAQWLTPGKGKTGEAK